MVNPTDGFQDAAPLVQRRIIHHAGNACGGIGGHGVGIDDLGAKLVYADLGTGVNPVMGNIQVRGSAT
ncbi:hypothetical protein [Endozoicomonas acroporae]|uniref:hypothetical protein n=1 Tax=Endozoicomonas acroporae TaxID=1701104 RepID=UPI000C781C7F|nr:hypothetical protein [Endozoicomonas acroporae]